MSVRILPDFLINQIAAGEVVERPASVVKELVENALDAGAVQIVIDVQDGGRTLISVIDNGRGMTKNDLIQSVNRHATSKLPNDNLGNIVYLGFRGEALPSIASVSDLTIDTYNKNEPHGWQLDATSGSVRPSAWEEGTRICVRNLFSKTPARLKFLRGDRSEMMSVIEVVKRLAMARPDVGFVLNNKWRYPRAQTNYERIVSIMGTEIEGRMIEISAVSDSGDRLSLAGFISMPIMRRASSVDQYLFVNNRPVKDKVLIGALRAAYMDVMSSREFPLCALYLNMSNDSVDVNVSPAKTDVHFLEPARVRAFIIKHLRAALANTLNNSVAINSGSPGHEFMPNANSYSDYNAVRTCVSEGMRDFIKMSVPAQNTLNFSIIDDTDNDRPLGRVIGQCFNKYIIAQGAEGIIIVDQHAAHERIIYEQLRTHQIKISPLLSPIIINMRPDNIMAIMEIADELKNSGLCLDQFGETAIAIFEKPFGWDMDFEKLLNEIAEEVRAAGTSSKFLEKMHLKLANYACHHSVRAGQRLDIAQMDALLRDIEKTSRGGQCNHGRPVWRLIKTSELDSWFERI